MKNLPYFWQIEDQGLRGDKLDGLNEVHRGTKGTIVFRNKNEVAKIAAKGLEPLT